MRQTSGTRCYVLLAGLALAIASAGSAYTQEFSRGDILISAWPDKIYRMNPSTFDVILFADASDGLDGVSALEFTSAITLIASNFSTSEVIEFDSAGNGSILFDSFDGLVGPFGENGIAFDSKGDLYISNFTSQQILRFPDGVGPAVVFADAYDGVGRPDGLAFSRTDALFVANREGSNILKIDEFGSSSVFDTYTPTDGDPFSIDVRH